MSRVNGLGLLKPQDTDHLRYGYVPQVAPPPMGSLKVALNHPDRLIDIYDQGPHEDCVAFMLCRVLSMMRGLIIFAPIPLWNRAKQKDGFGHPEQDRGTTVRAACDVLRGGGPWRVVNGKAARKQTAADGLSRNDWASSNDQIRTALSEGQPVGIGINWFPAYDNPPKHGGHSILHTPDPANDREEGGHAITIIGCDDNLDTGVGKGGYRIANNWSSSWADAGYAILPFSEMEAQMRRWAEVALVTLR